MHVARGARVRLLFGEAAGNPKLADPVKEQKLDEDGNPIEEEEQEPIPTKDLFGAAENIFANGVGTLTLTFVDVHGDEQILWRHTEESAAESEEGEGEAAAPTVTLSGLNYIKGPDPLPEPEPEGEEEEEDE